MMMTKRSVTNKVRAVPRHPSEDDDLEVVQVAVYITQPAYTARNMMLAGKFGPSTYDDATRKLTVKRRGVSHWLRDHSAPTV